MTTNRSTPSVVLHKHCDLLLQTPIQQDRPAFLSAASGLVCCDQHFFVVADDELHLGIFPNDPALLGSTARLLDGELPAQPKPRKKQKPDFEVLAYLPATSITKTPMLIVCGSGSRPNRSTGLLLPLNYNDELKNNFAPQPFDLSALYRELECEFGIVNIEGAVIRDKQLLLLQRGNKKAGTNAIVSLDLISSVNGMRNGAIDASVLHAIEIIELGSHADVPLGFTDAMCLPDGCMLALAVAEDTDDPYIDGVASAAYVCRFDAHNQLQAMTLITTPAKTEGIALWRQTSSRTAQDIVAFVTDADDPHIPASLLTAPLSKFL